MIVTLLRIFTGINALIALALVAAAVWPSSDPAMEKKPAIVVIYLVWALLFFAVTWAVFYVKPFARKWTIGLYGFASTATLWGFVSDVIGRDRIFVVFPWVSISAYLIFFAFFILPVVFMLRKSVKEYFVNFEEERMKAYEESGRATFRTKD